MRRIISLWFPHWPTDRLRRHGLRNLPTSQPLVTRAHDGRRYMIAAVDQAAMEAGISPGLPLAQAQALVPDLAVAPADPDGDAQALSRLAEWCLWCAPLTSATDPDGIWIDATGCAHLHGGETSMLTTLLERLSGMGLTVRGAMADTPGCAWALAHAGPHGAEIIPERGQAAALDPLPVAALRLDGATLKGLLQLGLERIGQVRTAPRAPLVRRFGQDLMLRLDQALGRVPEPVRPVLPRDAVQDRRSLLEPVSTADAIATVIGVLVDTVCMELAQRGEGARQVDLLCERVDGTVQAVRIGTASPVCDPGHMGRLLRARIETIEPGFGIEAMQLVVRQSEQRCARQVTGMPAEMSPQETVNADLLDRLGNRAALDGVPVCLARRESHMPERRQVTTPATPSTTSTDWSCSWPRPVRLFDPPEPVVMIRQDTAGMPRQVAWRGHAYRIVACDGPERVHGEWWHDTREYGRIRNYWIAAEGGGLQFWLFQSVRCVGTADASAPWFLHGLF
ncbi:DNA polymerase Y family protein [Komagataeibacter sp. SM21]|uniref:Y-family DNA polymerase n=1 Tax=Komagataeibacter sp. SM21 TaxID=3242899 RepID=UPI0035284D39